MTKDEWRDIFLGDILACRTEAGLRRWAKNFRDEIKERCPDHVKELRQKYLDRLKEIKCCAK